MRPPTPPPQPAVSTKTMHVAVVGAGLGGLAAAISLARAGARVTVLEATSELGEIGAGIQMFGNVSRFLVRCGIDKIIGDDLVAFEEARCWTAPEPDEDVTEMERFTGKLTGRRSTKDVLKVQGFPWWVVRRDHLHAGLARGAERDGVEIITGARISAIDARMDGVTVKTESGKAYCFDLVIGADGIKSAVRRTIFPGWEPKAASTIAAYRSVVPYEEVFRTIPEARSILGNTMDSYAGPGGYVLLYPLSAGKELNVVTAFHQDRDVTTLEDVELQEFKDQYKHFSPFVRKILDLVKHTKRWPLNVVPPRTRWSNGFRNVVLMGDAAHGMQNHMAQGAATAMEDGIFLGRIISEVLRGAITLDVGVQLYEKKRIPRCWVKQQSAFCMGEMWSALGRRKQVRDQSSMIEVDAFSKSVAHPELGLAPTYRTSMLFMSPESVPGILYYDAEGDADFAVCEWLTENGKMNEVTMIVDKTQQKWETHLWDNGVQRWQSSASRAKL